MIVKPCIRPQNLKSLISSARAWYIQQYPETPASVLQRYVEAEYAVSDWVKARHYVYPVFYFLYSGQCIVGFMRVRRTIAGEFCIAKIYLKPGFQGKGGGRMLVEVIPAASIFLDVYAGNTPAILAFRRMGFVSSGKIEFQGYGYRQCGIRMKRIREQKVRRAC
jgi:ribosomal protein S18 acetylase RimI-like enzyme